MKKISAQDKLNIVLELIAGKATARELSEKHQILSPKTLYNWRARLMESAKVIFASRRGARLRAWEPAPVGDATDVSSQAHMSSVGEDVSDEEADRELRHLYGVDLGTDDQPRTPKPRGSSMRGRSSLNRSIEKNRQKE